MICYVDSDLLANSKMFLSIRFPLSIPLLSLLFLICLHFLTLLYITVSRNNKPRCYYILFLQNARQQRINTQEAYQIILKEIEIWIETTKTAIEKFVKPNSPDQIEGCIEDFEKLNEEIKEKETKLQALAKVCEEFKKYPDLQHLVVVLLEQLELFRTIITEQKTVIITTIRTLQQQLVEVKEKPNIQESPPASLENTLDSTSMPIEEIQVLTDVKAVTEKSFLDEIIPQKPGVSIETQTGRSLSSPAQEPFTKDFTVTYNEPVDAQIQTQMSQQSSESETTPRKETIKISKRITRGEETIQIATKPMSETEPIVEEPDDILVEANYRKRPESETGTAELHISNVLPNQPFETVFVEPDETTTEVIVDADGTKRIIVKKLHRTVVRHQQSSQQQQLTTLSTLTEGDAPISHTFSQVTLKGAQSATTLAKGDGSKATVTSQQYGGKVVSGVPGGDIDVQEYETEPETHYTVVGPTFKPEEVEIQGIKLHEGDVTFVDNQNNQLVPADNAQITLEGSEIHTSSSSVRAVVQQVTRRIIRKTRRIIRRTVIIDGKEHVTEEIVEEPEEVEVTEEGIPRVSINVTRTEDGRIIQQQQYGEPTNTFDQPSVTVTQKTTTVLLDADGKPVEKLPENVTVLTQQEPRYVLEHHAQLPESTLLTSEIQAQPEVKPVQNIVSEFLQTEQLTSPTESSEIVNAPSVDAAHKDQGNEGEEPLKTRKDESFNDFVIKDIISIISADEQPHPTERTSDATIVTGMQVSDHDVTIIQTSEIQIPTEDDINIQSPEIPTSEVQTLLNQTVTPITPETISEAVKETENLDKVPEIVDSELKPEEVALSPIKIDEPTIEIPTLSKTPEPVRKETVTTQTSVFLEMEKSTQDQHESVKSIPTQTSIESKQSPQLIEKVPENLSTVILEEQVSSPKPIVTTMPEFEESPLETLKTPIVSPDLRPVSIEASETIPETTNAVLTSLVSLPLKENIPTELTKDETDGDLTILKDTVSNIPVLPKPETVKFTTTTEIVESFKPSERDTSTPSAPPYEDLPKIPKAITDTESFILSEKAHAPDIELSSKPTKKPKKRKLSKTEKVIGTPESLSPLETQEKTTVDTQLLPQPDGKVESKIEDTEVQIKSEEIEAVPKMEEQITDIPTVQLEKADITTIVIAEQIETKLQPQDSIPAEEKLVGTIVSPDVEKVIDMVKEEIISPAVDSIVITKSTTVTMEPIQHPQELIQNIQPELEPGTIEIQQTEEVTSFTKEPSGNVEMFLSLQEITPSYTTPVGKTIETHNFLENERKTATPVLQPATVEGSVPSEKIDVINTTITTPEPLSEAKDAEKIETVVIEEQALTSEPAKEFIEEKSLDVIYPEVIPHKLSQAEILLSLEEKLPHEGIATPKVSITMKVEEDNDRADILQKDIHVQLPKITTEKVETTSVTVSAIVPKLEAEYEEPSTPSDIDHGGRRSKKKKKHKESKTPTPTEKEEVEEKPESVISSLAESTEISIPEDSVKSEETPKPTEVVFEPISESDDDEDVQETGYEADKTTVDESLADDDDHEQKKRRKKKRRQRIKTKESEESYIPKSAYESSPVGDSIALTDDEPIKPEIAKPDDSKKKKRRKGKRKQSEESEPELESENTIFEAQDEEILSNNESYHTISTISEPHTIKIIEENIITSPVEAVPEISTGLVHTVPVLEAVITQEMVSQTSPIKDVASEFLEQERETSKVTLEQISVQTSPETPKETFDSSVQTLEEPTEPQLPKPEFSEMSTQIQISTSEIVTQTTPKSESPEEKVPESVPVIETTETSIQTISPTKPDIAEEAVQTVTPEGAENEVEQTPVLVPTAESAVQATVENTEDCVQTISPETVQKSEVSTQIQPDVSDLALQTSPEPSAPPLEEILEPAAVAKTEVLETITQTSPVIIQEIGEVITPSPTPTPSSSEQYEVHVQASVLVPSDISDITTTQTEKLTFVLSPSDSSSISSPSVTQSGISETKQALSETEESSGEYEIQIDVDGVPIDQEHFSEKFIINEQGNNEPHKRKRKRHRKNKKHHEPEQESSIDKDLFSAFHRQDTQNNDTNEPKLLYADVARRSRSSSPMPKEKETEITKPQTTPISKPENEQNVKPNLETDKIVQETKIETKVTSKVFTDLDEDKVKKIAGQKQSKVTDATQDQDIQGVDTSISIETSSTDSPEIEVFTKDVLTVKEVGQSPTSFKVESVLTETEHEQASQVFDQETPEQTLLVQSEIHIGPSSVISSTVDFLKSENVLEDTSATVFINDQPVKLEPEKLPVFDTPFYTVTQPEEKQKPISTKSKGKNKHVSSVTIEEIQSPTILTDTPLTPASDVGPLSPPDYATSTWQKPLTKPELTAQFITAESQQAPLQLKEVNVKWNQAQALERFKNLQNASKTTHLSDVLYLATLNEIITDETLEQHNESVQENLTTLQNAIERRDVVIIQQSIITTVETITTWLETIEYRIYVNRQQTSEGPSRERVQEFDDLKQEIANIDNKVEQLQSALRQTGNIYNEDDRMRMKQYIDSLQQQVRVIEEVTEQNEQLVSGDLKRWEDFENGVTNITQSAKELRRQLSDLKESDASPQTKLNELDMLENRNRCYIIEIGHLLASARSLMRDFPGREIPKNLYLTSELTKQLEQHITIERERVLQYLSLADEYEQTLKDFGQIILVAEALIESPIMVRNLEHLEDEMQNHRKFFVNLSHCRAILESLEENLDSETRALHSDLHQNLYERARVILDKSTERFKKMSLAASKWTVLEQGTREEMRWLQVAQQRVPDLNSVTSSDFERYVDLYQSLATDIEYHQAKLLHLDGVAQKLLDLIHCPSLEHAYTEPLDIIQKLQEDVQNNLDRLTAFRGIWMTYNLMSDKVEYWLKEAEIELKKIESSSGSRTHLRQFWELKAQHEVHTATKYNASSAMEKALQIVPISDEMVQRKFHSELNTQWQKVSKKISDIEASILETISAPNIPVNEKLVLLEQELQDLKSDLDNLKGVLKTEEELSLYVERLQIMSTRLETIQNELGKLGLLSAGESDTVGTLLGLSKRLEIVIAEELEGGNLLRSRLQTIQKGVDRVKRKQGDANKRLDQCESSEKLGSESVEKAVNDCYEVEEELNSIWQDLMSLRQLLHTLPMRLKVTVSPKALERDISQLQDYHTTLEKKCKDILALLRSRLTLWQRFERQLELIQQSVKEADFMVEILTVQGTVDYERLRKATERLEVRDFKYVLLYNRCLLNFTKI